MAAKAFLDLRPFYPMVDGSIVLAYRTRVDLTGWGEVETVIPTYDRSVPLRFSIAARNRWMLDRADTVVTYVDHSGGGAARFQELAYRKGKRVILLGNYGRA